MSSQHAAAEAATHSRRRHRCLQEYPTCDMAETEAMLGSGCSFEMLSQVVASGACQPECGTFVSGACKASGQQGLAVVGRRAATRQTKWCSQQGDAHARQPPAYPTLVPILSPIPLLPRLPTHPQPWARTALSTL